MYAIRNFDALEAVLTAELPLYTTGGRRESQVSALDILKWPYGTVMAYFELGKFYVKVTYDEYYRAAKTAKWRVDRATTKMEAFPAISEDGFETHGIYYYGALLSKFAREYPKRTTKVDPSQVRLSCKYWHLKCHNSIFKCQINGEAALLYLWWDSNESCTGFVVLESDEVGRRYAEKQFLIRCENLRAPE